ncbi:MAG: DUF6089 family protein [Bacteroidota bacterium]
MLGKFTISVLLIVCFAFSGQAQSKSEFGTFLGIANYQGDFVEGNVNFSNTRFGFGVLFRHHFTEQVSARGNFMMGLISGSDLIETDPVRTEFRKLEFNANIFETSAVVEYFPLRKAQTSKKKGAKPSTETPASKKSKFEPQFSPYIFAGVGYTVSQSRLDVRESNFFDKDGNPDAGAIIEGVTDENQGINSMLAVPFGGGVRYDFTKVLSIGGEASWRWTNSDFLDGFTGGTEVQPINSDWYFFIGVVLTHKLGDN